MEIMMTTDGKFGDTEILHHPVEPRESISRRSLIGGMTMLLLAGCGGASISEYQQFAQAGIAYAAALEKLFEAATIIHINADSERLLANDTQTIPTDSEAYKNQTEAVDAWIDLISRARNHSNLLKRYFGTLNELATSNAPQQAKSAGEKIGSEIAKFSTELINKAPTFGSIFGIVADIALKTQIQGALRNELQAREKTIRSALKIQEELIAFFEIKLTEDLKLIKERRLNRYVRLPYISNQAITNPDAWIDRRRMELLVASRIDELGRAKVASAGFSEAFDSVLTNELTLERTRLLLADIEDFLKAAEKLAS
jgi:hypothetical protein